MGRLKTRGGKRESSKNAGVEIAGVENAAPDCRGGKRGSNEYGKPKFPLFNIVTTYKWVTTANRTNVNQKDFTHLHIFYCLSKAELYLPI